MEEASTRCDDVSADGYYLAAYCINATSLSRAEVEWIVISKSINDEWVDRDGNPIHPFYTIAISEALPAIPSGWIEYLHAEADRTCHPPKIDLVSALGLKARPPAKIERRL